jgi:hypothetical protein
MPPRSRVLWEGVQVYGSQIYTVNGNNLGFFTLTPTLSHRERELKEVAINGRSKYNHDGNRHRSAKGKVKGRPGECALLRFGALTSLQVPSVMLPSPLNTSRRRGASL